jgi:hypothetical protein
MNGRLSGSKAEISGGLRIRLSHKHQPGTFPAAVSGLNEEKPAGDTA